MSYLAFKLLKGHFELMPKNCVLESLRLYFSLIYIMTSNIKYKDKSKFIFI